MGISVNHCFASDIPSLTPYNVVWDSASFDSRGSMPLGNGEVGANVWVEKDGDLLFYLSKTDAWADDVYGSYGLPKLGRVRVHLEPNPFREGTTFRQELQLSQGSIQISASNASNSARIRVWIDANNPVVHVDGTASVPTKMQVSIDRYREKPANGLNADTILPAQNDTIGWCYRNQNTTIPALTNRTFGALIRADGMKTVDDSTLISAAPQTRFDVRLYPLTAQTTTVQAWRNQARVLVHKDRALDLATAFRNHQKWWQDFWDRSWVLVSGDDEAQAVTQNYLLQRFVTACAGRGSYPIKFNGSLFTTDYAIKRKEESSGKEVVETVSADHRTWGGQYWFQNTRAMYWPLLQSGDFEMMLPLFRMYFEKLPASKQLVREYYNHDGVYFAETSPFWAELPRVQPEEKPWYTNRYYTPILELSVMMLDYFDYTGDREFATKMMFPLAEEGLTFFEKHFPRDARGHLYLKDANSIETYWKVNNPAPDIAGLRYVVTRLLALSDTVTTPTQREHWRALQAILPDLPLGGTGAAKVLRPFESADDPARKNGENPELYAVYPFRIYGVDKADLALARDTFAARQAKGATCWSQDAIHAAYLGDSTTAKQGVLEHFSAKSRDASERFPVFWGPFNDYTPDQDNGGNGMNALQLMLLQAEGEKLLLLPAWTNEWNADFKLHAPQNTVVRGKVQAGKLVSLEVTPPSRRKDVVVAQPDGSIIPLSATPSN